MVEFPAPVAEEFEGLAVLANNAFSKLASMPEYVSSLDDSLLGQFALIQSALAGGAVVSYGVARAVRWAGRQDQLKQELMPLYACGEIDTRPWLLNAERLYNQHKHLLDAQ